MQQRPTHRLRAALTTGALACAFALAGCDALDHAAPDASAPAPDAAAAIAAAAGDIVPGEYIVVLKEAPGARQSQASLAAVIGEVQRRGGATVQRAYEHALTGFSARLNDAALAALQSNPRVDYIEPNRRVYAVGTQTGATWGLDRIDARALSRLAADPRVAFVEPDQVVRATTSGTQTGATWGLDRIDARSGLDGSYTYNATGAGVTAYVLDTGIRTAHAEFGGRATVGFDAFGGDGQDCNGHGTHVAGTVGGATYGVAKDVGLVAVRVLDCDGSGTTSGVIAGVDWVTANASGPAVANMSLGGGASTALDAAVQNSINAGTSYAVAAGNGDFLGRQQDACTRSPARVADAITISATDNADRKASWANYGSCVDFFAPGVSITSAWYTSNTATNTISGTSMATPHVAGAAALYLEANPAAGTQAVRDALYSATTKSIVQNSSTANNHLLYTLDFSGGGGTPNNPPTAAFTYSASDLTVSFTDTSTDSDGTIVAWSWAFGDNATATAQNPTHTYAADGTYTVALTVTDNAGATSTTSQSVTVSGGSTGGGISLDGVGYKSKGRWTADLTWAGATSGNVDVYREGSHIATTANDGAFTDKTSFRGSGSLTYEVCEAGTSTCSNSVVVSF